MAETALDSSKFIAERNANQGKPLPVPATESAKVNAEHAPIVDTPNAKEHVPRSVRRQINRLQQEAAYERGRREALEATFNRQTAGEHPKPANEEPNRNDFQTDQEYASALTRYEVKQQVGRSKADDAVMAQLERDINAAKESFKEQQPLVPDWDKINKAADKIDLKDQLHLQYLIAVSPMQAHVIEYMVQHPEETQKLISFAGNDLIQGRMFNRIEGKVEAVYNERKAAQASPKDEDRNHLAEASQAGRIERKTLPKPASEVSLKNGTTPPSEPAIGSPEWMELRNQAQYGRHS